VGSKDLQDRPIAQVSKTSNNKRMNSTVRMVIIIERQIAEYYL
jgi:hypothetical protein